MHHFKIRGLERNGKYKNVLEIDVEKMVGLFFGEKNGYPFKDLINKI